MAKDLWNELTSQGWVLQDIDPDPAFQGRIWIIEASHEASGIKHVAEGKSRDKALQTIAAIIRAEEADHVQPSVVRPPLVWHCFRPPSKDPCPFNRNGSCIADTSDQWGLVRQESIVCRYRQLEEPQPESGD